MAETLSKADLAVRLGVKPSAVSNYIARGKLTAPALRSDGTVESHWPCGNWEEPRSGAQHRARRSCSNSDCRAAEDARFIGAAHFGARARGISRRRGRAGA